MQITFDTNERFSGSIARIGDKFGFIRPDDGRFPELYFHRSVCDMVDFESLEIGTRLRFGIRNSKSHIGKLVAGRISYETKN